jgi:hypothetical protein
VDPSVDKLSHQHALDNETFDGETEISVTTDFGAAYDMKQQALEKSSHGTSCNQLVLLCFILQEREKAAGAGAGAAAAAAAVAVAVAVAAVAAVAIAVAAIAVAVAVTVAVAVSSSSGSWNPRPVKFDDWRIWFQKKRKRCFSPNGNERNCGILQTKCSP